ncbi:hypothetical protein RhiirA5_444244 [Rhizophagus irregularis]|uniref:Uncharacterized protein n=1 Tax=Rhizophagus irregularis TaxID=588596 RepID=A0A2N0NDC9_9GLOM|nr:hypothetical protein RhiirA5_444244 [Rhizophagus irregularis]
MSVNSHSGLNFRIILLVCSINDTGSLSSTICGSTLSNLVGNLEILRFHKFNRPGHKILGAATSASN